MSEIEYLQEQRKLLFEKTVLNEMRILALESYIQEQDAALQLMEVINGKAKN